MSGLLQITTRTFPRSILRVGCRQLENNNAVSENLRENQMQKEIFHPRKIEREKKLHNTKNLLEKRENIINLHFR